MSQTLNGQLLMSDLFEVRVFSTQACINTHLADENISEQSKTTFPDSIFQNCLIFPAGMDLCRLK